MGSLTYSHTLVAGTPENVNDVQDMFNDARTVINGNVDGVNAPALMTPYRILSTNAGFYLPGMGAQTLVSINGSTTVAAIATTGWGVPTALANGPHWILINAAALTVTGLTTRLRTRVVLAANATAPAMTSTIGLYPVSSVAGGVGVVNATLGVVIAGSSVAFVNPAANSITSSVTADYTLPADGNYILGNVLSGSLTANSSIATQIQLEARWT